MKGDSANRRWRSQSVRKSFRPRRIVVGVLLIVLGLSSSAGADPCGMVPPIYPNNQIPPLARTGAQKTYVFYRDGIETFVIRPGYEGKVEDFGMLIPFPSVPALRKVSDDIFPHIAKAIDPPEVLVDLRPRLLEEYSRASTAVPDGEAELSVVKHEQVRVLKEEAVGMYEVAVLEAGSTRALKRWMDEHGYTYPNGMDNACNDYIDAGWCFVAVKTRVVGKQSTDPQPGQRKVQPQLPPESSFDGHVQAMGFRFRVEELVVPMRLSAFNEGELHNIVYLLTDEPSRIRELPSEHVVRQVPGEELFKNVTEPLPLRVIGGTVDDIPEARKERLKEERNPVPHNGAARDMFAADLLAVREDRLAHPHEEREKELLRIGEALNLRGPELDDLHEEALQVQRDKVVQRALENLKDMTLTVIDGDFPRDYLAENNLRFARYEMPAEENSPAAYDAVRQGPAPERRGRVYRGALSAIPSDLEGQIAESAGQWGLVLAVSVLGLACIAAAARRGGGRGAAGLLLAGALTWAGGAAAEPEATQSNRALDRLRQELRQASPDTGKVDALLADLVDRGPEAVPELFEAARDEGNPALRGWAIVALTKIGGDRAQGALRELAWNAKQPELVRTWALAGRIELAGSMERLLELSNYVSEFPALKRPFGKALQVQLASEDRPPAEEMLQLTLEMPQLQQVLAPAVLTYGSETLCRAMATADDQRVRRQATAYLATLASQGKREQVAESVVAMYTFQADARDVPWSGGPLFVPSLDWSQSRDQARTLVRHLIAWHLWCEINEPEGTGGQYQQQIHNNLRSVQLARAAGYQSPGFNQVGTDEWLRLWGRAAGKKDLEKLLQEQGLAKHARYRRILEQLP